MVVRAAEQLAEPSLEAQLGELLSKDLASVTSRERSTFDELTAPFGELLVLFGAGTLGRKTLTGLRRLGIEPLAFVDNNPALWGTQVQGVRVWSPQDGAKTFRHGATFVITIWTHTTAESTADLRQQLADLNCSRVVSFRSLFWKHPEVFLPHYSLDLPHKVYEQAEGAWQAFALWADDSSRREYLAQVRWRVLLDFGGLPPPAAHEQYFPGDLLALVPDEVFVDCGAFDGDTVRSFLQARGASFRRISAFEPDPASFLALQRYVSQLPVSIRDKTTIHQLAVGARSERVRFDARGTAESAVGSGALEVDCVALDDILSDCLPTYIKMDVEGSELDALLGTRRSVERADPVLAICVYHRQDHLWSVPLLIRSLSDRYSFFLRPHGREGWDLVCYAVPTDRLRPGLARAAR